MLEPIPGILKWKEVSHRQITGASEHTDYSQARIRDRLVSSFLARRMHPEKPSHADSNSHILIYAEFSAVSYPALRFRHLQNLALVSSLQTGRRAVPLDSLPCCLVWTWQVVQLVFHHHCLLPLRSSPQCFNKSSALCSCVHCVLCEGKGNLAWPASDVPMNYIGLCKYPQTIYIASN